MRQPRSQSGAALPSQERAAPAGRDEPDTAVISQPLRADVIIFLFLQCWAAELTQPSSARHGTYRGGEEALLAWEHTQSRQRAERELSPGQERGRHGDTRVSSEQTPAPTSLLPQQEAIFKQQRLA